MARKKKPEPEILEKQEQPIYDKKEEVFIPSDLSDLVAEAVPGINVPPGILVIDDKGPIPEELYKEPIKVRDDGIVELDDFGNPVHSPFGAK